MTCPKIAVTFPWQGYTAELSVTAAEFRTIKRTLPRREAIVLVIAQYQLSISQGFALVGAIRAMP